MSWKGNVEHQKDPRTIIEERERLKETNYIMKAYKELRITNKQTTLALDKDSNNKPSLPQPSSYYSY